MPEPTRDLRETFRNGRPEGWGQGTIKIGNVTWPKVENLYFLGFPCFVRKLINLFFPWLLQKYKVEYDRQAPVHEWTKKPLGEGCRWERQTLDKLPFPVYAFFMP